MQIPTHDRDKPVGFYGPIAPPVPNAPEVRSQHNATPPVQFEYPRQRRAAAAVLLPESPWDKLQNVSVPSVLFKSSQNFFLQYTGDTDVKNDGP